MNMKLVAVSALMLAGFAASADVLYWQVNNSDATVSGTGYAQAYLKATDGTTEYYVPQNYAQDGVTSIGTAVPKSTFDNGGYAIGDLASILSTSGSAYAGDLSALSFYLELYSAGGDWLGKSAPVDYDKLGTAVSSGINANFTGVNNALGTAANGGTYTNVPEPTSGLLMLVGFGALALRRRKVA